MIKSFNQLKKYNCKDLTEYFDLIIDENKKENFLLSAKLYNQLSNSFKYKFIFYCGGVNATNIFINISVMILHPEFKLKNYVVSEYLESELKNNIINKGSN